MPRKNQSLTPEEVEAEEEARKKRRKKGEEDPDANPQTDPPPAIPDNPGLPPVEQPTDTDVTIIATGPVENPEIIIIEHPESDAEDIENKEGKDG